MKKTITILMIGLLVVSGLGAVALPEVNENKLIEKTEYFSLSSPVICEDGEYISVELEEATSFLMDPGKPVLPRVTETYILPFGSNIKDVFVEFSETTKQTLSKEIRPASEPIIEGKNAIKAEVKSIEIYSSSNLYPDATFSYRTCTGLDGTEHVVFLTVQCYPVRYSPAENTLYYSDAVKISVTYEEPSNPITFLDEYDLVVIAPSKFEQALQPLIEHKNSKGMNTSLKTTEEIYAE
ncbi:MAG: peptidase C25, partial [Thermoplasmatales archaeon]|nr:peptidase C25 [Thermoplasmatales archaeon]